MKGPAPRDGKGGGRGAVCVYVCMCARGRAAEAGLETHRHRGLGTRRQGKRTDQGNWKEDRGRERSRGARVCPSTTVGLTQGAAPEGRSP